MDAVTELETQDVCVRFRVKEAGYCFVSIQCATGEIDLGGDLFDLILQRFGACISDRASITPTDSGAEPQWKWFLSLMEPIHSLYLGRSGDKYLLRVEDEHATVVAEGSILEQEARQWQRQLTSLIQERGCQGVQGL